MRTLKLGLAVCAVVAALSGPVHAKPIAFDDATIADLSAAFAAGTLTAEKLVEMCLARIEAYDRKGPALRAVIMLNPKALETARALDAERKAGKVRGPMHGIPVVLKDNFDTFDLPTTGGSVLLEGSIPPDDAFMVKKLRDAGAIILAKVNLSEFASSSTNSSMGGQSRNPHDVSRTPAGSSGGTGVAVAAGYAPVGLGTDTGGSIRGPSNVNGIAGLKPTHGLVSRDGIIPLALSFDTGGPMARSVYDVAVSLGVMTGVDPADPATKKSQGKFETDYTKYLKVGALKGARIGIARDFAGYDPDVDFIVEAALATMKQGGATVVDVKFPKWFLDVKNDVSGAVISREFASQINDYLATTKPGYPKNIEALLEKAYAFKGTREDGAGPNPNRWMGIKRSSEAGTLNDPDYLAVRDHGLALIRAMVENVMAKDKLDAIVYPTGVRRAALIAAPPDLPGTPGVPSPTNIANITGFPDLIVPAGFTSDDVPVAISFMGTAFSEGRLFGLGYDFEQRAQARRRPVTTPALPGATIDVPGADESG